ncbi:MAG: outer membrane beta-barrel protein [Hyphomonas sp.]|uniref:outer membrane beta-barrel protein n=1 Tax=Hyphomonas sp. TaxID=87 RepID=UPI00352908AE
MTNLKRFWLLSVAAGAMISSTAYAQEQSNYYSRDKYQAVMDRRQPEFDPEPIRLGAFLVDATALASITSNSNVFAAASNEQSDVIARVGASVAARTNWSVHQVGAEFAAYRNEFSDFSTESNTEWRGALRGRLDVTRDFSFGASVFADRANESRTEPGSETSFRHPVEIDRTGVEAQANYTNDRVRWTNSIAAIQSDFECDCLVPLNGITNVDYRDRDTLEGRSRLSYAVSPNVAVFAQGTMRDESYKYDQVIGGVVHTRDSSGYTISGGADFELTALVRGDIAVGYLSEKKDDPLYKDVDGLSVDGRMQWFPTRLTTVTFTAGRRAQDVGAFESPSVISTDVGARIDHELKRNIILSGSYRHANYDYQEADRKDDIDELGAGLIYKMNKKVHLEGFVRSLNRDSSGTSLTFDRSYGVNLIGVQLSLHP